MHKECKYPHISLFRAFTKGFRFRLVALQLDYLGTLRAVSKIKSELGTLPKTLDEFYSRILVDIDESDRKFAYRALQWLVTSARPLTLREIVEAVTIQPNEVPCLDTEDRFLDPEDILRILPAGLVEVIDIYIQFSHFSVKEYITSPRLSEDPEVSDFRVFPMPTHNHVAQTCLAYLLWVGSQHPDDGLDIYAEFPLYYYAAGCWPYHISILESLQRLDGRVVQLASEFLSFGTKAWDIWTCSCFDDEFYDSAAEEIYSDSEEYLQTLVNIHAAFPPGSMFQLHPTTWISAMGFSTILISLLSTSSDINETSITPTLGTPLHAAAMFRHDGIVKILLSHGANPSRTGGYHTTPLIASSFAGTADITRQLLKHDATIDTRKQSFSGKTALIAASEAGFGEIVLLLVENGANTNMLSGDHKCALVEACWDSHNYSDIIRILLQAGARPDALQPGLKSPLQAAAGRGAINAVRVLLEAGANVNAQ